MTLYAESSAVVSWLLGEPPGDVARRLLASASTVFASELTLLECDRAFRWAEETGRLRSRDAEAARLRLQSESAPWNVFRVGTGIMDRARRRFPREPVRALDALHLATVLRIGDFRPGLGVLSFDRRIRANAAALGFDVLPADPPDAGEPPGMAS